MMMIVRVVRIVRMMMIVRIMMMLVRIDIENGEDARENEDSDKDNADRENCSRKLLVRW